MREYGAFALVFVAGCSLVWDMDPYDTNTSDATRANDGGASSSGAATSTSGGSSGGSSGASSSGASSGDLADASTFEAGTLPGDDAGSDAAAPPTCTFEVEPNNLEVDAEEITAKKTCGKVSQSDPVDYFFRDVGSTELIGVEFGPYVSVTITYGDGTKATSTTPGGYYVNLKPGENTIKFTSTSASFQGAYAIYR